jgi:DNA polymerase III subunit epsilon
LHPGIFQQPAGNGFFSSLRTLKGAMLSILFHVKKLYYLRLSRSRRMPSAIRDHIRACLSIDLDQSLRNTGFAVFDTETTGLRAGRGDRVVSISAVLLRNYRIDLSESFHTLVNPNRDIPSHAARIHGILSNMVEGKPSLEEVLPKFLEHIGRAVLVGHHVWLDMTFLNREMKRFYGVSMQNVVLDTAILDQAFMRMGIHPVPKEIAKADSSLKGLAERYGIANQEQHSSFSDALATAQIFQKMIRQAERCGVHSLKDLLRLAYHPPSISAHRQDGATL